jgi:chemotaxis signal transduction protein
MLRLDPSVLFSALDADHLAESVRSQGLEDDRRLREVKPPGATDKYLLFTLLDEGFALPVEVVDEISLIKTLTPLPEAPDYVAGLTQIRGLVRVVVDLNKRLSMPELSLAAQDLLQQITEKIGKAGSSAVDEELSALLGERFHRKGIGHRACRLLHDYLSERSLDHAFCLEAFEQALEREIRHLEENRKLLLLSGAASCALLVDRVLTVTDVSREERLSSLTADENVQRPAWFGGSFFREELGRTFLIPDLGVLLGGTGQHGVSAPVQDTRGAP